MTNPFKRSKINAPSTREYSLFQKRLFVVLTIGLSITGASLIALYLILNQGLRLDEAQTLWQSSHTLSGVIHTVALDVHVPLYHVIVHFWMFFFGNSVETVRLLSLLFFVLTIPVVYLIARFLLSRKWALLATVLFSFSPFMDWYAGEARMYTLLVLLASLNQYFFLKILKRKKGWIGYGLTAVIGAYSHYFFLFTLLAEGIYFLVKRKQFAPKTFRRFVVVAVLVIAALSPWLYYVRSLGSASGTRPLLPTPSSVDFSNVYSQFLFGFQTDYVNTILLSSWPIVMLLALVAVRRTKKVSPEAGFIATMAALPVILAFVISLVITPFFLSRYMVSCVAPLLILIVWLFSQYKSGFARAASIALILITILGSVQQIRSPETPVKENYKEAVAYINENVVPQDLVVISAPFTIYPVEYYYTGSAQIQTLPKWDRTSAGAIPAFDESKLPEDVANYNKDHRYIYLLLSHDQGYEETIEQYYLKNFKQISSRSYSDDLTLYVYQVGYYTVPPLNLATEPVI